LVIAALICFVVLVVAWIVAPDGEAATHAAPAIEPELAPAGA
jgi:hypothetical protein